MTYIVNSDTYELRSNENSNRYSFNFNTSIDEKY